MPSLIQRYFILYLLRLGKFFLRLSNKKSQPQQTMNSPQNSMTTPLTHYQYRKLDGVLAVVRYTVYDGSGKITAVDQETYQPEDMERLQEEMAAAMDCGIECLVITDRAIEDFPVLSERLNPFG